MLGMSWAMVDAYGTVRKNLFFAPIYALLPGARVFAASIFFITSFTGGIMKAIAVLTLAVFGLVAITSLPVQAASKEKEMMGDVQEAIAAFKKKDPTIEAFFKTAYGYVVFPSIAKGGFIVGGAGGKGLVFKKGAVIGSASLLTNSPVANLRSMLKPMPLGPMLGWRPTPTIRRAWPCSPWPRAD
jgi:hypothetical protein